MQFQRNRYLFVILKMSWGIKEWHLIDHSCYEKTVMLGEASAGQ